MGILFSTVAGFLAGTLPLPLAFSLYYVIGDKDPYVTFIALATPLTALLGGLLGAWFAWRNHQPF
jgi:hypothetical protein